MTTSGSGERPPHGDPGRHRAEALDRGDIEAMAATRMELGRDYEPALLDAFADRVEAAIDQRVAGAVQASARAGQLDRRSSGQQLAIAIASLVAAIPISIVLGVTGNFLALLVAWVGIVAVNWAHAFQGRRSG